MKETIETLRHRMVQVADKTGSLYDPEVLAISRQLDLLLVQVGVRKGSEVRYEPDEGEELHLAERMFLVREQGFS